MDNATHPVEVVTAYEHLVQASPAEGRVIEIEGGHKIHVVEAGAGPPLVMLHGTGSGAFTLLPLLEQLEGVRALAPDRPGSGLSDLVKIGHKANEKRVVDLMEIMGEGETIVNYPKIIEALVATNNDPVAIEPDATL